LGATCPTTGLPARALRCKKQKSARERARSARELSFYLKERARARARARAFLLLRSVGVLNGRWRSNVLCRI